MNAVLQNLCIYGYRNKRRPLTGSVQSKEKIQVKQVGNVAIGGNDPKGAQLCPIASKDAHVRPPTAFGFDYRWGVSL